MIHLLLSKHEKRIRRILSRRSGPLVLTGITLDDLYHETVAVAIKAAEAVTFENDAHFVSWISTIARRVCNGALTRQDRSPQTVRLRRALSSGVGVPEWKLVSRQRTPSSMVVGRERAARLRDALGELPDPYGRVIILYRLRGMALDEVAKQMDRTKGATCRLFARAMKELRNRLAEE